MNVGEAIVKILEDTGVADTVFGGSGQSDSDLLFALSGSKKIRTVIVRHEQAASFMACGYAMFSDKLGVCFATAGPGAFNLLSGLGVALSDSLPVLSITPFATSDSIGKGDLGETSGMHRTPDSQKIFAATTKGAFMIKKPEDTCAVLEEALNLAFEGRPGPVSIEIPYDISNQEVPNFRDITLEVPSVLPQAKKITQFADVLAGAIEAKKKTLALFGYGCVRAHAESELLEFVEKFQIPFMTTMDAKGVLPENHPLCVGVTGVSGDPGAKKALREADVVLAVGNSFAKWSTWKFRSDIFDDKTLLHVNIDRLDINKVYQVDHGMVADARSAMTGINEELAKRVRSVDKAAPAIEKYSHEELEQQSDKIHSGMLVQELSRLLPERAIVLGDAGGHMLWLHAYLELNKGQNYQNPGSFGPMASHVNGAIGVQCANPGRSVIAAVGDGDYQMAGFELLTAVQNKIPVIWIIFDNGDFNIIKYMQKRTHDGEEVFNHFLNPDFAAFAKLCGARGYRVEQLEELAPALKDALASGEPAVLDVVVDPEVFPPFARYDEA